MKNTNKDKKELEIKDDRVALYVWSVIILVGGLLLGVFFAAVYPFLVVK